MDNPQSKPKPVEQLEKRKTTLDSKIEQWLNIKYDGGDLYLDAMKRLLRNQPTKKK